MHNARLKAAREHRGLSRDRLAELVNAHVWSRHGRQVEIDANYIGKLERGVIHWPREEYRDALRTVLGAGDDHELGLRNPKKAPSPERHAVTSWDITQIDHTAEMISELQHRFGGWSMRELVTTGMSQAKLLLGRSCPDRLHLPLHRAVARFAHTAGFSAFDTGEQDVARRHFAFGLSCAEESGDWHIRAYLLASLSRQATWTGAPETGLSFAMRGLMNAHRLTATERAMLHAARARALATMHDTTGAISAIGAADEHFSNSHPAEDQPWMNYYDHAQHCGDTGAALLELAMSGAHVDEARARISAAADGHGAARARSRLFAHLMMARLAMTEGDTDHAVTIGSAVLPQLPSVRSHRIADYLHHLDTAATTHQHLPAVHHLRTQIATHTGSPS